MKKADPKKVIVKRCFHTPKHIFTMGGIDYYAADREGVTRFDGDMIINLTSTPNFPVIIPEELREHYDIPSEEIMVPWPDLESPRVKMSFWETIHRVIEHRGCKTVCVHCAYGHGRTGTALSCILVAMCGHSAVDAVDTIREYHCEEAVETSEQCFYVMEVDRHYNNRELTEENFPLPSMMVNWEDFNGADNANMGVDSEDEDDDEETRVKK
ncbi:MAG: protein-tyrosine phosphatase family protein [Promethearchaeota archaeon]|jgi:hypothetical protein